MSWYYSDNGQQKGPLGNNDLDQLVTAGVVRDDTLIWREGMPSWQKLSEVRPSAGFSGIGASPEGTGYCAECGRPFLRAELVMLQSALVCGSCKPIYLQRLREGGAAAAGSLRYGGFWIRFAARLIDGILLQMVFIPLRLMLGLGTLGTMTPNASPEAVIALGMVAVLLSLLSFVVAACYEIFMTGLRGATLGKMALGLKVVRADGGPVSLGVATARYFATLVSAITLGVGYIMAGFDDQKRSLHDRICETRVVRTR